jgi:cell division protein FtsB
MSSPAFQIRPGRIRSAAAPSRVTGIAGAAIARARLTVVPRTRTRTSRLPFVTLVSFVLLAGVIGLLMFNTSMQQAAFATTSMEQQAATLTAREQTLRMELDTLRDPQRVARQAQRMGMVMPAVPAFLRLADGEVLGTPTPATRDNALRLLPRAPQKPAVLDPAPNVVTVEAAPADPTSTTGTSGTAGTAGTSTGAASGKHGHRHGRNHQNSPDQQP